MFDPCSYQLKALLKLDDLDLDLIKKRCAAKYNITVLSLDLNFSNNTVLVTYKADHNRTHKVFLHNLITKEDLHFVHRGNQP